MKLISMTDFVLERNNLLKKAPDAYDQYWKIVQYARFLKRPLTLGMFVPCDENGNVLEDPEFHEPNNENEIGDYDELRYQYQEAKSKIIFEGFKKDNSFITHKSHSSFFYPISSLHERTIEDLVPYNLDLTISF